MSTWYRVTPFMKQGFVTTGVALNIGGGAAVMAFVTGMLPQLKTASSGLAIDDTIGSWIAATPSMCLLIGNLITPFLMNRFGRRLTNITSVSVLIVGWLCMTLAKNITMIILARFFQGVSMGMSLNFGPILIGEYTSPKRRGAFLMFVSVLTASCVLVTHAVGSYFTWQCNAFISMLIAILNLIIVINSPESPAWLASKYKYDDCKKVFRWLRGDGEEIELAELVQVSMYNNCSKNQSENKSLDGVKSILPYFKNSVLKKDFYMPIFIMAHVYGIGQWAGINVLATYTKDVFENIIGRDNDIAVHIIALDVQRIVSNIAAMFMVRKLKRRTMLLSITLLGIFIMLITSGYSYTKTKKMLPFDHSFVGIALIHLHMFTVASCTISLPYIIAGEIFPLEHKGVAGGISILFLSLHFSLVVKCTPYLFKTLGIYGAYALYASIVSYCLLVAWIFLPETKDRTLQDIENDFAGKVIHDIDCVQSLTSKDQK